METSQPSKEEIALHHLVESATEDLAPNRHFSLKIGDIALRQDSLRTFEQMFNQSLERTGEVKAVFAFDETTNQMYPQAVHLPLDKSNIRANIVDDGLEYTASFSSPSNTHKPFLLNLPNPSREQLMEMLDVEQPPSHEGAAYRLWLSELLGRSDSWSLREQQEILLSVDDSYVTSLILRNFVTIQNQKADAVRSVSHKTSIPVTPHEDTSHEVTSPIIPHESVVIQTTLEAGSNDSYTTGLWAYREYGEQDLQDLTNAAIEWSGLVPLSLQDEDNTSPLLQMAYDAVDARRSEK